MSKPACGSVSEPVGDRQQLVSLLHGLDFGVRQVVHGLVAAPGVIQKLLLRRLELANLRYLQVRYEKHIINKTHAQRICWLCNENYI